MPSSRQTGRISASRLRVISEYSICRSATGWTACARRIVSAPASDRPRWRTWPARISSAIAPTVSSIGTAGIDARRPVDVDMVGAEALQAVGQEILHRRRPGVEADQGAARVAQGAELDREHRRRRAGPGWPARSAPRCGPCRRNRRCRAGRCRRRARPGSWPRSRPGPPGHRPRTCPCSRGRSRIPPVRLLPNRLRCMSVLSSGIVDQHH